MSDPLQDLLRQEYQRLNRPVGSHYHKCAACGVTLVCCCPDRREVDRATGKVRKLYCITCGDIRLGMQELELECPHEDVT
jgi:hypothetical protein